MAFFEPEQVVRRRTTTTIEEGAADGPTYELPNHPAEAHVAADNASELSANSTQTNHLHDLDGIVPGPGPTSCARNTQVKRALKGYHIFFISVSGTLGIGLYVRSANMLRIGGPGAVLVPFALLGILAWMVMQCISEMLLIWPISGALRLFVEKFVDKELGTAVAVAYWFTYAMSFAALIAATAGEASFWTTVSSHPSVQATVFFLLCSATLFVFNLLDVRYYGLVEVVGGSLKLLFVAVVVSAMIAVNVGAGECEYLGFKAYYDTEFFSFDPEQASSWGQAFFMALQIAAFAFIGIEIPAVLAVEADIAHRPRQQDKSSAGLLGRLMQGLHVGSKAPANAELKFSAVYLPFLMGVIYVVAGFLVTLNVEANDASLPRNHWTRNEHSCDLSSIDEFQTMCGRVTCTTSNSGFVISAHNAQIPGLPSAITVFLIVTALSSANTTLYVASRTLYDLGRSVEPPAERGWRQWSAKCISVFGRVSGSQVPHYAVLASMVFIVIPFLSLLKSQSIPKLLYILAEMAAECCIIVWACECFAFLRFWKFIHMEENKAEIRHSSSEGPMRFLKRKDESYPYKSSAQPLLAAIALFLCLVILFGAGGASLWNGGTDGYVPTEAIAGFLAPVLFFLLWLFLKFLAYGMRFDDWFPYSDFIESIKELNDERDNHLNVE
ncbi:hypothetical protein LTR22_018613 [Elasticomyces elasticus]|nr:hypothetical protein LTR22_018613 [Elasticomyces elasticus]KAK5751780.1 hypothetical protein LTS12_018108 [Elasticomyces elasticus]